MADIRPTPEQRPIVGGLARLLETADKFARKPFGYENPPAAMVSDFLSIPPLYRTLENYAYGSPLASGTSSVSRYLPKLTTDTKGAIEGAINVSPLAAPVIRGTRMATTALGKAGERMAERTVPSIMQRGNVGADLLSALASGTTSNVIKPEGGNWIKGATQKYVDPLRRKIFEKDPTSVLKELNEKYGEEGVKELMASGMYGNIQEYAALNRFADKKLAKYIQNELGTPSDPLRLQADAWADMQQKLLADKQKQIDKVRADIDRVRQERDVNPEVLTRSQARLRELQKEQDLIKNRKGIHYAPVHMYDFVDIDADVAQKARKAAGMPIENMAVSPFGRRWEDLSDRAITQASYEDLIPTLDMPSSVVEMYKAAPVEERANIVANWKKEQLERMGGQYAVDNPEALAYGMNSGRPARSFGFDHMMDELQNSLLNEALPEYLRLTPKTLDKMSVAQAAEHVDKINAWRASQKAEVDKARAANAATVVHKEYPEQGLKWVELKVPEMLEDFKVPEQYEIRKPTPSSETFAIWDKKKQEYIDSGLGSEEAARRQLHKTLNQEALQDALKYEGEILQHCVGGYCPDVVEGRSRIFSLRDEDGRPHATIEVEPSGYRDVFRNLTLEQKNEINALVDKWGESIDYRPSQEEILAKTEQVMDRLGYKPTERISQIKGLQNKKPEAEFIPYIQDFVKSGDWSHIGDLENTELASSVNAPWRKRFEEVGIEVPDLFSPKDYDDMVRQYFEKTSTPTDPQFMHDTYGFPLKATGGAVHMAEGGAINYKARFNQMLQAQYAEGGKKKPSPFDELMPTFGQRMGAAAADKLTEAGLWLYDKLADRDKLSAAHKIYLDTFVHDKRDPITAKDFSPQDLAELQNLILQKEKLTGKKGAGYIKYDDYSTLPGGNQQKAKVINLFSGVLPPRAALSKALGQFNYERDPKTGQFRIIDEYDFNPQHIRVDGEKVEVPAEFYGDYVEDAGFSPYALARLYGGRKMPPGTGRKVELSVPSKAKGGLVDYDPDEIAQLAQNIVEGLAPYGLRHSGEGVKGKGYFGELAGRDGVVTEMSTEDESGEYPLVVPTLTAEELDSLIAGEPLSEEIYSKARSWADTRRARGQSPFADPTELRMPRPGYATGGIAMQVGGGVSSLIKMMKRLSSEGSKAEKATDLTELVAKLPKASPEVEARVQAQIAAREKARREMYDVPKVDKTTGKAAIAEMKRTLMTPEERVAYEAQLREQRAAEQGYMDYLHGTERLDRLLEGKSFDPKRATSGPMPFGTTGKELASSYAMGKPDTSRIAEDFGEMKNYFQILPKDIGLSGRNLMSAEDAWRFLPKEKQVEILDKAKRIGYENPQEATGRWVLHEGSEGMPFSESHWNFVLNKESGGNPLTALRKVYAESGTLDPYAPSELADIYRLAGFNAPISQVNAPWTEAKGVFLGKARITNPLNTTDIDVLQNKVIPALKEEFKNDRTRKKPFGADQWDKNVRFTPKEWVDELERDIAAGENSYVWTSIPDKVTKALKDKLGYNGIIDTSGKGGTGTSYPVVIPFEPGQIRSRFAAFDPEKIGKPDLLAAGVPIGLLGSTQVDLPKEQEKKPAPQVKKAEGGAVKKAKGGVVDYDPAEIDALVSQLKEEFHG